MPDLLVFLRDAVGVAFFLLGLVTFWDWLRRRDRAFAYLALAIGLLAVVVSLGQITSVLRIKSPLLGPLNLFLFIGSGYALLRYRAQFLRLGPTWEAIAAVAALAAAVLGIPLTLFSNLPPFVRGALTIFVIAVYCALVGEPIVRFWLVSRGLTAVQRQRLRALSLGFAALVAVLLFAVVLGALFRNVYVSAAIELVVLGIVPLLYASFSPPAWLRRQWRGAEEEELERFLQRLVTGEPVREEILLGAFEWAARLAGARRALALSAQGKPVAGWSAGAPTWPEAAADVEIQGDRVTVAGRQRPALFLPLRGVAGADRLVLVGGPYSPRFGSEEVTRVQQHLNAVAGALDRASLIEGLREANLQLRDANQHKSVFLANMSHELRTPLNAILGFSELLIDDRDGQYDAATRESFLDQIHGSGKHLLGLINDILDLSKVEAGQMELRPQEVDVREVVQDVLNTVQPLAAMKQIEFASDVSGQVTADPGKLKQMLLNLVSNAIKFTPSEGKISISSRVVEPWFELAVADTGVGIAPEDRDRIFEAFQQVDSSAGRQQAGTGLGLTLTRRFAALHGGDVTVDSESGKGSVFTIRLPLQPAQAEAAAMPAEPIHTDEAGERPLVVVVEDSLAAAELLVRQLHRGGFAAEVARTGTEALAMARDLKPVAITLDILLPELDGWSVLTRLKEDPATREIPVVVVSVVDDRELGLALGAFDYLVKPVAGRELLERLQRIVAGTPDDEQRTVLVVDDEEANRRWLQEVLEPAGFDVTSVDGGQAAIERVRSQPPDLILLDLMMPEVTGFDVVEALRADPAMRAIPILVLTAKNLTAEDKRMLNGQVAVILSRGSTGAVDLISWLQRVLGGKAAA